MADSTVELLIRLKTAGFEQIEQIKRSINELKGKGGTVSVGEEVKSGLDEVNSSVNRVGDKIKNTINNISNQVNSTTSKSVENLEVETAKGLESFYARSIATIGAIVTAGSPRIQRLLSVIIQKSTDFSSIASLGLSTFKDSFTFLSTLVSSSIQKNGIALTEAFTAVALKSQGLNISLGSVSLSLLSLVARVGLGASSISIITFLLKDAHLLIRRILGSGLESLTPLERAGNLVTLLDVSLKNTSRSIGLIVSTISFGSLAAGGLLASFSLLPGFLAPLTGLLTPLTVYIIPAINSFVSLLSIVTLRARLRFFAFFGSSKAQISLIVLEVKQALALIATQFGPIAQGFRAMRKEAGLAEKQIKLVGNEKDIEPLRRLANTKLPLAKQFQIASLEIRVLLDNLIARLDALVRIVAKAGNLSESEVKDVEKQVESSINKVSSDIKKATTVIAGGKGAKGIIKDTAKTGLSLAPNLQLEAKKTEEVKAGAQLIEKSFENIKDLVAVTNRGLKETVQLQKEISKITPGGPVKGFSTAVKPVSLSTDVKSVPVPGLTGINKELQGVFQQILTASKGFDIGQVKGGRGGGPNIRAEAGKLVNLLGGLQESDLDKLKTRFNKLFTDLLNIVTADGKELSEESKRINALIVHNISKSFKFTDASKGFADFSKTLEDFKKSLGIKGNNTGETFVKAFSDSLNKKSPEALAVMEAFLRLLSEFLPSSPPKRGPLLSIVSAGGKIVDFLVDGIKKGESKVVVAAKNLAKKIAAHFPQSPAQLPPLSNLVSMGFNIPTLIAQGMEKGAANLRNKANLLGRLIVEPLKKSIDLLEASERAGVRLEVFSAFSNTIEVLGGNASELNFVFSNLNAQLANVSVESIKEYGKLGINLQEVQESGNPAIELFFQLSDVLKNSTPASNEARLALEKLGTGANTNLFNILKKGRTELQAFIDQTIDLGAIVKTENAETAKSFVILTKQIEQVEGVVKNAFLAELVPKLQESLEKIKKLIIDNGEELEALAATAGDFIGKLIKIFIKFIGLVISEPDKAKKSIELTIGALVQFATTNFDKLWVYVNTELLSGLIKTTKLFFSFLYEVSKEAFENIFSGLSNKVDNFLKPFYFESASAFNERVSKKAKTSNKVSSVLLPPTPSQIVVAPPTPPTTSNKVSSALLPPTTISQIVVALPTSNKASSVLLPTKQVVSDLKTVKKEIRDISEIIEDAAKKSSKELADSFKKISESSDKTEDSAKKNSKEFEKSIVDLKDQLKDAFKGTGLEEDFKGLLDIGIDSFKKLKDEAKALREEVSKPIEIPLPGRAGGVINEVKTTIGAIEREKGKQTEGGGVDLGEEFTKNALENIAGLQEVGRSTETLFTDIFEIIGNKSKEAFFISRSIALAQASINIAEGITKVIAAFGGSPIVFAQAALVTALGIAQTAKIAAQTFFTGGHVAKGKEGIDNVLAYLTKGEFVLPVSAVKTYGLNFLEGLRTQSLEIPPITPPSIALPGYQRGGLVGGVNISKAINAPGGGSGGKAPEDKIKIANFVDKNVFKQFLDTNDGRRTLINILGGESRELRRIVFG